jgi:hypothetical protein
MNAIVGPDAAIGKWMKDGKLKRALLTRIGED